MEFHTEKNLYPQRVYPLDALPHLREQVTPLRTYPVRVVSQDAQVELVQGNEVDKLDESIH